MCGIAGFAGQGDSTILDRMTDSLVHRGPDARGTWVDEEAGVFLGHRRLAIIDIAGGAQPMWDAGNKVCIVFNGEIYNHADLRTELVAKGYRFKSDHSDTEVLLNGYREWGRDLPARLNGMFAFVIYDPAAHVLFLARDRFGEKPLYIAHSESGLVFASELSALLNHPSVSGQLDIAAVQKFFAYGYLPAPNAIYTGCRKLPAASHMTVNILTGHSRTEAYWQFTLDPEHVPHRTDDDYAEELRELLVQSVGRRIISDVPIGFFLSGGVDSSAIVAAARNGANRDIKTFTVGFDEPSFDESAYAEQVAHHLETDHASEILRLDEAKDLIPDVLGRMDEPLGDPSLIPTYLLCRMTRRHVTVALSGDGGDELFAGYDPFKALGPAGLFERLVPRSLRRPIRRLVDLLPVSHENMSMEFRVKRALLGLCYDESIWNPVWMSLLEPDVIRDLFDTPLDVEELYSEVIDVQRLCPGNDPVERSLNFFTRLYLQDDILTKVDRASMMSSLEARAVFLDNDIVDFACRLPTDQKFRNGEGKGVLKRAVRDWLPPGIADRKKKGFGLPIGQWLRDGFPNEPSGQVPGLSNESLQTFWQEHRLGRKNHRLALWGFLAMQPFGTHA